MTIACPTRRIESRGGGRRTYLTWTPGIPIGHNEKRSGWDQDDQPTTQANQKGIAIGGTGQNSRGSTIQPNTVINLLTSKMGRMTRKPITCILLRKKKKSKEASKAGVIRRYTTASPSTAKKREKFGVTKR